jgi:hypothetical protein
VHKNEIPILAIVTAGLESIELPPLRRPDVPNDTPDEALVLWGAQYYTYCVIAHIRDVLRGMVELLQLGSVATAFFPARHAFEWTAHTCLISRELKDFITKKDWKGAKELQSRVMEGNRWVKDYGTKYVAEAPGDPYDQMADGLRVKNALRAYEKYQEETTGTSDSKDERYFRLHKSKSKEFIMLGPVKQSSGKSDENVLLAGRRVGKALASKFTAPPSRKSQMISCEVHAVETARIANIPQSSLSFPSVSFVSLNAERAIMPMTAAPMP